VRGWRTERGARLLPRIHVCRAADVSRADGSNASPPQGRAHKETGFLLRYLWVGLLFIDLRGLPNTHLLQVRAARRPFSFMLAESPVSDR